MALGSAGARPAFSSAVLAMCSSSPRSAQSAGLQVGACVSGPVGGVFASKCIIILHFLFCKHGWGGVAGLPAGGLGAGGAAGCGGCGAAGAAGLPLRGLRGCGGFCPTRGGGSVVRPGGGA